MHRISRTRGMFVVFIVNAVVCDCLSGSRSVPHDHKDDDESHFDKNTISNSEFGSSLFQSAARRSTRRSFEPGAGDDEGTRLRRDIEQRPVDSEKLDYQPLHSTQFEDEEPFLPVNEQLLQGSEDERQDFYDDMLPMLKSSKTRYRLNPRLRDIVLVSERPPEETKDDDAQINEDDDDDVKEQRTGGTSQLEDTGEGEEGEVVDIDDRRQHKLASTLLSVGQDELLGSNAE